MSTIIDVSFPGGQKVEAQIEGRNIQTDQSRKRGGEGSDPEKIEFVIL